MHRLGKVQDWNDGRGYGYIAPLQPADDAGRIFFHIRDYQQEGRGRTRRTGQVRRRPPRRWTMEGDAGDAGGAADGEKGPRQAIGQAR